MEVLSLSLAHAPLIQFSYRAWSVLRTQIHTQQSKCLSCSRAVKLAEKRNYNFLLKYQHSNVKGINSAKCICIQCIQTFQQNVYFNPSYCTPISLCSVCLTRMRSEPSLGSLTENRKMEIFPLLSIIYRWRIYLWNISNAFRKRAQLKQLITVRAHADFLWELL